MVSSGKAVVLGSEMVRWAVWAKAILWRLYWSGWVYEPAGIVHKGEIVWSQEDIARAGGVGIVEAMRQDRKSVV